jgi:hypothetical protein
LSPMTPHGERWFPSTPSQIQWVFLINDPGFQFGEGETPRTGEQLIGLEGRSNGTTANITSHHTITWAFSATMIKTIQFLHGQILLKRFQYPFLLVIDYGVVQIWI